MDITSTRIDGHKTDFVTLLTVPPGSTFCLLNYCVKILSATGVHRGVVFDIYLNDDVMVPDVSIIDLVEVGQYCLFNFDNIVATLPVAGDVLKLKIKQPILGGFLFFKIDLIGYYM